MTQKERQEKSKKEIGKAAMEEFGTHHYSEVTMESICTKHGISKGMMYHYFNGKDPLFLLCVEQMFQALWTHLEKNKELLESADVDNAVQQYFSIREDFFLHHPKERMIYENAILRTPEHLQEDIQKLRQPMREFNQKFLNHAISKMPLREGITLEEAIRYFDSVECFFWPLQQRFQTGKQQAGWHTMENDAQKLLDLLLYGIVKR
jgi:TetR/AcrR family transcriptional regulator